MVARYHGLQATSLGLAREVEVHRDGIAWLDLAELLEARGLEVRVVQLDAASLRAVLVEGLPVVISLVEDGVKHAVVVVEASDDAVRVLDPAVPDRVPLKPVALAATWAQGQAVVVRKRGQGSSSLPWDVWQRQDALYRANEWLLRARRNGLDQPGTRVLVERGLAAWPTHPELIALRRALTAQRALP